MLKHFNFFSSEFVVDVIVLGCDKVRMESHGNVLAEGTAEDIFSKIRLIVMELEELFSSGGLVDMSYKTLQIYLKDGLSPDEDKAVSGEFDYYIACFMHRFNTLSAQSKLNIIVRKPIYFVDRF